MGSPKNEVGPLSRDTLLRREFGRAIGEVSRAWRNEMNRQLKPFGINASMRLVLMELHRHPEGLMQRDLAERLGIEGPTLVRLLERLEDRQWVARTSPAGDRRRKIVTLTPMAAGQIETIERVGDEVRRRAMAGLDRAGLEQGLATMSLLRDNLGG